MRLDFISLSLTFGVLLGSCGEAAPSQEEKQFSSSDQASQAPAEESSPPDLFAADEGETVATNSASASCPAGAQCFGPIIVEAGNFSLTRSGRRLAASGSIVIRNRSADPISVAALEPAVMNLPNGYTLQVELHNARDFSGLFYCNRSGAECYEGERAKFRQISADDSSSRVNLTARQYVDEENQASLRDVEIGDLTMKFYVVSIDGDGREVDVTFSAVPIQNQISN